MNNTRTRTALLACALLAGCGHVGDIARDPYPAEQAQIKSRLDEIWKSAQAKDLARLKSYHLYGEKFTEFKDGAPRGDSASGEQGEREFFSAVTDLTVDMKDLRINVFGEVAVATFLGDLHAKMAGNPIGGTEQGTMVLVKSDGEWRIVHEHFSPLAPPKPGP